nr:MAG TPA: hypothetical protein [Caudoviricetes sp.]
MASLSGSGASHKTESFFLSPANFSLPPIVCAISRSRWQEKGLERALEDVPGCGRAPLSVKILPNC